MKTYTKPEFRKIELDIYDIIATSTGTSTTPVGGNQPDGVEPD